MEKISDVQKVEVNSPLMRKTKVQLVEIILRKDDKEQSLNKQIKSLEVRLINAVKDSEGMEKQIRKLEHEKNSIKADFESNCDEHVSIIQEYKNKIRMCTLAVYIMAAVAILALLFRYMGI